MNVFEDFIDELKEENLLEETVIESRQAEEEFLGAVTIQTENIEAIAEEIIQAEIDFPVESENVVGVAASAVSGSELEHSFENPFEILLEGRGENNAAGEFAANDFIAKKAGVVEEVLPSTNLPVPPAVEKKNELSEKDFYRKRAIDEVSGLQMVEHVLSGVEREQMKLTPQNYNEISAKKALHDFLQIADDVNSPEHARAEFQLMQETETWCSALSHRDKIITVAHLRRYCETTRPALSSQALISLARFYRNLPYSEAVRSKFDFCVTKLFSKDDGQEKRVLVFTREELIQHFKELYAEWSSISLYSVDDDDSSIVLAALKFEDFMTECESATDFDELVKTDFFNRLRQFKQSANEVFFAPLVTTAAIECNARVGNRYVDLIQAERAKKTTTDLQDKYGFLYDQTISDATSKTLQLIELLKEKNAAPRPAKLEKIKQTAGERGAEPSREKAEQIKVQKSGSAPKKETKAEYNRPASEIEKKNSSRILTVNKWLLAATILVAVASAGLYYYVYYGASVAASANVKRVNLENSSLQEFLETARIGGETFYGVTLPAWEALSSEKKEEVLKKIYSLGEDKGYSKVELIDKEGKSVGFASKEKVEVIAL